jgi:hypothetical protein
MSYVNATRKKPSRKWSNTTRTWPNGKWHTLRNKERATNNNSNNKQTAVLASQQLARAVNHDIKKKHRRHCHRHRTVWWIVQRSHKIHIETVMIATVSRHTTYTHIISLYKNPNWILI